MRNRGYEGEVQLRICDNNPHCTVGAPDKGPCCAPVCATCHRFSEAPTQHDPGMPEFILDLPLIEHSIL
jgi:hypothetical protein